MGKLEDALRDLIQYHSRRAAREMLGELPARVRSAHRDIRGLRKSIEELAGQVRELLNASGEELPVPPAPQAETERARFSRRSLKSIRKRFDLSQQELAQLLEVSSAAVTSWESGRSRPRKANIARIITLRNLSKEEVNEALGRKRTPVRMTPDRMKRTRRRFGLTQRDLAQLLGVSTGSVTAWESGKVEPTGQNRQAMVELRELTQAQVDEKLGRKAKPAPTPRAKPGQTLSNEDVKEIRNSTGLSQKALADKLGVSSAAVSHWETGRSAPRTSHVQRLRALKRTKPQ